MSESTTENITDIDSALSSIIMPEEPIEESPVEETRETEEISADADTDLDIDLDDENTEEEVEIEASDTEDDDCLLYTSPSPRD